MEGPPNVWPPKPEYKFSKPGLVEFVGIVINYTPKRISIYLRDRNVFFWSLWTAFNLLFCADAVYFLLAIHGGRVNPGAINYIQRHILDDGIYIAVNYTISYLMYQFLFNRHRLAITKDDDNCWRLLVGHSKLKIMGILLRHGSARITSSVRFESSVEEKGINWWMSIRPWRALATSLGMTTRKRAVEIAEVVSSILEVPIKYV